MWQASPQVKFSPSAAAASVLDSEFGRSADVFYPHRMAIQVCAGATTTCSFGMAPSTLMVLPVHMVMSGAPSGNIGDSAPIVNVLPFGACTSLANPTVAAATAAALGVLTPMPCVPVPAGPWVPGSVRVLLKGMPALDNAAKAMCAWGGVIQIVSPGQVKVIDA